MTRFIHYDANRRPVQPSAALYAYKLGGEIADNYTDILFSSGYCADDWFTLTSQNIVIKNSGLYEISYRVEGDNISARLVVDGGNGYSPIIQSMANHTAHFIHRFKANDIVKVQALGSVNPTSLAISDILIKAFLPD